MDTIPLANYCIALSREEEQDSQGRASSWWQSLKNALGEESSERWIKDRDFPLLIIKRREILLRNSQKQMEQYREQPHATA